MASGDKMDIAADVGQSADLEADDALGDDLAWGDDDDEGGEGEGVLCGPVRCLFCPCVVQSVQEVWAHCVSAHRFSVTAFCRLWALDCLGYIRLINYIRTQCPTPEELRACRPGLGVGGVTSCPWNDDGFMKPADPDDLLLQFDIEWEEECGVAEAAGGGCEGGGGAGTDTADDTITVQASHLRDLIQRLHSAEAKAAALEADLQRAVGDLNVVRQRAQELMGLGEDGRGEGEGGDDATQHGADRWGPQSVEQLSLEEDQSYFSGYGNVDIHNEMLKDRVRTESYRAFMVANRRLFEGRTVLDVGCGTGILSMFAAQAGARHVIAVDQSEIIYSAMDIARENGLDQKITFVKGRMDKVQLPCEKVDIIISEWMGYFLLFESMLDTVIGARDKYLVQGGMVYPDKCWLWLAGFHDAAVRERCVEFWEDVYGFSMTCLQADVLAHTGLEVIAPDNVITTPARIKEFDINTCTLSDVNFKSSFSLTCCADGALHGFVGYFDTAFQAGCTEQVHFSTGPASASTHWKQTVFLLKDPLPVSTGQELACSVAVTKCADDPRSLDIRLTVDGATHTYLMQ